MSKEKKELSLDALELVSGGALAEGWQGSVVKLVQTRIKGNLFPKAMGQKDTDIDAEHLRPLVDITNEIALFCGQSEADKVKSYLENEHGVVLPSQLFSV